MTIGQAIAAERRSWDYPRSSWEKKLALTRQSISKWKSDAALPELEKLIALSRLSGCRWGSCWALRSPLPRKRNPPRLPSRWKCSSWQSASPGSISGSSPSPDAGPAG